MFRLKTPTVQAFPLSKKPADWPEWAQALREDGTIVPFDGPQGASGAVKVGPGFQRADLGDWIVTDEEQGAIVVKADDFTARYEAWPI